jgi:hypothetical protein
MCLDPALGEEPQCFPGVGAFLDSKNLYFQSELFRMIETEPIVSAGDGMGDGA